MFGSGVTHNSEAVAPTSRKQFVYQLKAKGFSACFNGTYEKRTSTVFLSKEIAESKIPKFLSMILDTKNFDYPLEEGLEIQVVGLEVVE